MSFPMELKTGHTGARFYKHFAPLELGRQSQNPQAKLKAGSPSLLRPLTHGSTIAWTGEIHGKKGYLAFGDGRVDLFTNASVGRVFKLDGEGTNHLAVP